MAQTVDAPKTYLDSTVRLFDQFYNFDLVVEANQYDIVFSYFYDISKSKNVAGNFTLMLFRIASVTGENTIDLLEYMKSTSNVDVTSLMAYYLNSIKSKTTLYGINAVPQPNQLDQRNIVI